MRVRRRWLRWTGGALAVVLVAVGLGAWGISRVRNRPASAGLYETARVERRTVEVTVSGTGTLEAAAKANITAEVPGTVRAVHFEEGDTVRKGQVLIELRNDDLSSQVASARIQVASEEMSLYRRAGVPEGSPLDTNAALTVTAPVSGRISRLDAALGKRVEGGVPVAWIAPAERVLFRANVPAISLPQLSRGQRAWVHLDAFDGQIGGTVVQVGSEPVRSEGGETYTALVEIDRPGVLGAGYKGQVAVETPSGRLQFSGQTEWGEERAVTPRVGGIVVDLPVSAGQVVRAGQVLARLQNPDLALDIKEQRLRLSRAQQELESKERSLDKLTIRAPISGVVSKREVAVGDTVGGGQGAGEVLATILDTSALRLSIPVDELDVPKIRVGQAASVTVSALPGRTFPARVEKIAAEARVQNGVSTFDVTLSVAGDPAIRPGMTGTATLVVARRENVLAVPAEAVIRRGDQTLVQVLQDGRPVERPVRLGLRSDRWAEVLEGVQEGDAVVVATPNQGFNPFAPPDSRESSGRGSASRSEPGTSTDRSGAGRARPEARPSRGDGR